MKAEFTEPPSLVNLVGDPRAALDQAGAAAPRASPMALAWSEIRAEVATALDRDLRAGGSLIDRLAEGWSKAEALSAHAAGDARRGVHTITLGAHDFDLILDPDFTLAIDGVDAGRLLIELVLSVGVEGAVLTLRDGAITEAELGKVRLSGRLECARVVTPLALATPEFTLLGKHRLARPAPIPGA